MIPRQPQGRIGVLSPFRHSPSFLQRLEGVADALAANRYELVLTTVTDEAFFDHYLADPELPRRLDGLLVVSMDLSEAQATRLTSTGLPAVLVEKTRDGFPGVDCDDAQGGRLVADLFARRRWAPCAFVGGSPSPGAFRIHPTAERCRGFAEGLAQAGAPLGTDYDLRDDHTEAGARRMAARLLDLPHPPRAIFAGSDFLAAEVLKELRARGARVPGDVALVGFDDVTAAGWLDLSTVSQRLEESGHRAVELLLERIREPFRALRSVRLEVSLLERGTTLTTPSGGAPAPS
jgi:LacI family transcriptional regulator